MTHSEIKEWCDAQDWVRTFADLGKESGLTYQAVAYRYRKYTSLPLKKGGRPKGLRYASGRKIPLNAVIDFRRGNLFLALQYGCTIERIRQLRRQAGNPQPVA